jgi:magnesium-protoporphyrin O-methyltransferase
VSGRAGDFVAIAADVPDAEIVTLDRVICCYADVAALVGGAANHARRAVGLVYPRVTWWIRAGVWVANRLMPFLRRPAWIFVHPDAAVHEPLHAAGFRRRTVTRTLIWQVVLYVRA